MNLRLYEQNSLVYNKDFIDLIISCIYDDDLIRRIENELRLGDNSLKKYFDFFNFLKNNFNIASNIIEVGYGDFPILSLLINHEQQLIGKGSITAFERRKNLVKLPDKYNNLTLKSEFNTNERLLPECDLLVGMYPCDGMFPIFSASKIYDLEYCITICSCYKKDYDPVYKNAISRNSSDFIISLDTTYSKSLPLLLRRKK